MQPFRRGATGRDDPEGHPGLQAGRLLSFGHLCTPFASGLPLGASHSRKMELFGRSIARALSADGHRFVLLDIVGFIGARAHWTDTTAS